MASRLTSSVKAGGCASKLNPKILERALQGVPRKADRNVLVGYETSDDAGVYNLTSLVSSPLALVQTVDFFTPIVDDPQTFGGIAAANALSDIYAMGGRPISALSLLAFPARGDFADLEAMLKGGAEKLHEAGCVILGGHSISDEEIKFGYSITGLVHPERYWTNAGARDGDVLLFSKRIGTGVISSALKSGFASASDVAASIEQMLTLNSAVAQVLTGVEVHACTDVTGFGLLGHAREMALASNVTLEIMSDAIQFLPGARDYSCKGAHSAGLKNNREFVESCVKFDGVPDPALEALLYDPQTSGGLLISLPPKAAEAILAARPECYSIGRVKALASKPLEVL
jgi:selenide, water dikinase